MDAPGHAHDDRSVQFLNFLWRNNTFLVHETSAQFYCSSMGKKKLSVHETTAPFLSLARNGANETFAQFLTLPRGKTHFEIHETSAPFLGIPKRKKKFLVYAK